MSNKDKKLEKFIRPYFSTGIFSSNYISIEINHYPLYEDIKNICPICNNEKINKHHTLKIPTRLLNIATRKIILTEKLCRECYSSIIYWCVSHTWDNENKEYDKKYKFNWVIEIAKLGNIDWIWIDNICIYQDDEDDKIKEIPKMFYYYTYCKGTIVLIDDISDNIISKNQITKVFLGFAGKKGVTDIKNEDNKQYFLNFLKNNEDFLTHVYGLFLCKWFKRVWTFQEMCLSKNIILFNNKCSALHSTGVNMLRSIFTKIVKMRQNELSPIVNKLIKMDCGIQINGGRFSSCFSRCCYYSMNRYCFKI